MSADMIQTGEELFYDVTYLNIKLGTIKIITLADTTYQGEKVYHSKVYIQSNPNIPFYSLKSIFNSYMDTSLSEGRYFESNSKEQDFEWGFQKITFRDKRAKSADMKVEKWYDKEKINDSTYYSIGKVIDGSSLFFFARKNSDRTFNAKVPTIMDMTVGDTKIKFTGKTEKVKIDAIKYPVNTYYVEGKCEWVALYGLGDKFQGWFSCDEAKIPIKAKMNVYIGSVVIELKNWKRTNWNPPK
jgi:hypothetical protein